LEKLVARILATVIKLDTEFSAPLHLEPPTQEQIEAVREAIQKGKTEAAAILTAPLSGELATVRAELLKERADHAVAQQQLKLALAERDEAQGVIRNLAQGGTGAPSDQNAS
jgi:hypothetical protein